MAGGWRREAPGASTTYIHPAEFLWLSTPDVYAWLSTSSSQQVNATGRFAGLDRRQQCLGLSAGLESPAGDRNHVANQITRLPEHFLAGNNPDAVLLAGPHPIGRDQLRGLVPIEIDYPGPGAHPVEICQ